MVSYSYWLHISNKQLIVPDFFSMRPCVSLLIPSKSFVEGLISHYQQREKVQGPEIVSGSFPWRCDALPTELNQNDPMQT